MKLTHQMDAVMSKVKRSDEPYRQSPGSFLLNGEPILRSSLSKASTSNFEKLHYCGTCGKLLNWRQEKRLLDITVPPPTIHTCANCKQLEAFDDGYDDVPKAVALFQEWRLGRVQLQKEPQPKKAKAPSAPQPTPPLVLRLAEGWSELHPINSWRKPERLEPPQKSPIRRPKDEAAEERYSDKGWFRDLAESEVPYTGPGRPSSPSKEYIKWLNGQGPAGRSFLDHKDRVTSASFRLLPSTSTERLVRKLQDGTVPPTLGKASSFDATQWSGFAVHEAAKEKLPGGRQTRRLRRPRRLVEGSLSSSSSCLSRVQKIRVTEGFLILGMDG